MCSSLIVNVITSFTFWYPAGACSSSTVYVPLANPVSTNDSVVDWNLVTTSPDEFFTTRIAPGKAFSVDLSSFVIVTTLSFGSLEI